MTDADKITNPQHFGSDPVDIRIRIRINPETRIRNTDHFLLSLDTLAEVCALRAQSRSTDRCLKQITELSSSMSYQRHHNVAVSGHKDQHSTSLFIVDHKGWSDVEVCNALVPSSACHGRVPSCYCATTPNVCCEWVGYFDTINDSIINDNILRQW